MRHPPTHRRAPRLGGFTLVEVMIALTLLALVSTALVRAFTYSFETKRRVTAINERYHEGRQTMVRIARELRMAFLRAEVPEELREEDPMMITRFEGREDQLHFTTTAHLRIHVGAKESDQSEVAYFLDRSNDRDSPYRGRTLFRRESKRVDNQPERGGHIWPVIDGVKEFKLEYWDDKGGLGDDQWRRDWNSHDDPKEPLLPARVRITLELESPDEGGPPIRFVTQAAPQLRRPIQTIEERRVFDADNPLAAGIDDDAVGAPQIDPNTGLPIPGTGADASGRGGRPGLNPGLDQLGRLRGLEGNLTGGGSK